MNIGDLREQHERIMRLAAELHKAVDSGEALQPVAAVRWRLARELMAHLAIADRLLYPTMMRSSDPTAAATASRFHAEMGGLSDDFTSYLARWNDLRIAKDWDAFRAETKTILNALAERVRREDETLYPLAGAVGIAA